MINMIKSPKTRKKSSHHQLSSLPKLPKFDENISNIAIGAAAGCILGVAAALLLTPKYKGHKLTRNLDAIYDSAEEYAHEAFDKGQKIYNNAVDSAENLYEAASNVFSKNSKNWNRNLVLGILGAGLLGASAVFAISHQTDHDHQSFADRWKTSKWSDMAKLVVDTVSNKLHDEESEHEHHNPIQNALDWAATGLNIWQQIKARR